MRSIRSVLQEIESVIDMDAIEYTIKQVLSISNDALSILDDIESIVNEAESVVEELNKCSRIELDDTVSGLKEVSASIY